LHRCFRRKERVPPRAKDVNSSSDASIRSFNYGDTAAQMLIVAVIAIDPISARLRKALI
jgi:hypothetical protein